MTGKLTVHTCTHVALKWSIENNPISVLDMLFLYKKMYF